MATLTGGGKLEGKLREFARWLSGAQTVRIGFLKGATYPNGTPVALVAAVQEFGAPRRNIPPRPFFRDMIAARKGEWPAAIATLLKSNDFDAKKTLQMTGEAVAGQLRKSISDFHGAPLKPATIARKGSSKQLIDSGVMLQSVSYEVKT